MGKNNAISSLVNDTSDTKIGVVDDMHFTWFCRRDGVFSHKLTYYASELY